MRAPGCSRGGARRRHDDRSSDARQQDLQCCPRRSSLDFQALFRGDRQDRAAANHYPTMALEDIKALRISARPRCCVFLWATVPMLPHALEAMTARGFTYKSNFVWVKDKVGTGFWSRNQHEILLVGTRGSIPCPAKACNFPR